MASSNPLTDPPTGEIQDTIIKRFWGKDKRKGDDDSYGPYFKYYATECKRLKFGVAKKSSMVASTHEHVFLIVGILSRERHLLRPQIRSSVEQQFPDAPGALYINHSIDFALRVWLTLNVRPGENSLLTPQTPTIQWDDDSTLDDFIARQFPKAVVSNSSQLDYTFTAVNICRVSGIEVEWTPCLADHLRYDRRRRVLRIYPFKRFLLDHLEARESLVADSSQGQSLIIPIPVLEETLLSLSLLFPHWDTHTDNFMVRHHQTFHRQGPFEDPRHPLNLSNFDHWRSRLLELDQVFHSPPVGWAQIWVDRRNPLQWYTFWLAIVILLLTVIFGIVSTVTGIIQTCLAFESIKLARLQVNQST